MTTPPLRVAIPRIPFPMGRKVLPVLALAFAVALAMALPLADAAAGQATPAAPAGPPMEDLGDGRIYQEPNISILHYAGNGLFSYEEDAYNPHNMGVTIGAWIEAKKTLEEKVGTDD